MALRSYSVLNILLPTIIIIIHTCAHRHWKYVNACGANLVEVCLTCCQSSRLPFIVIIIYGVVCVQLAHFSLGDWKDISIAHVIIIIRSELSTLPIIAFFHGYVSEKFVASYSATYCIFIPGKPGFCFHYYCAVYDNCKWCYSHPHGIALLSYFYILLFCSFFKSPH